MAQTEDSTLFKFLSSNFVGDMPEIKNQQLIKINKNSDLKSAFRDLIENKITAAPVYDKENNKYVGILDLKDYTGFLLYIFGELPNGPENLYASAQELAGLCEENPFISIETDCSMGHAIKEFCIRGLHRMPVAEKGKVTAMLSQSTIIQWMSENKEKMGMHPKKSIKELMTGGLGTIKPVYSANEETMLLQVFKMLMLKKIHGCPVVDKKGKLVGNLSISDMQFALDENISNLSFPVKQLVNEVVKRPPVSCVETDSLFDVIDKLTKEKLHRIYVVDKDSKPTGVITLTDVMDTVIDVAKIPEVFTPPEVMELQ